MPKSLKVAFVGGPMYDGLYDRLPLFEKATGLRVEIGFKGDHPALNEHLAEHGGGYDLVSTHNKYSPSQAHFLRPLDGLVSQAELARLAPAAVAMSRYRGELLQIPRVIDSKIVLYLKDLFDDPPIREAFRKQHGRELAVPETWDDFAQVASFCHQNDGHAGFVFPGKESGLFGHFYEMLESAGGELFTTDLEPAFASNAGRYAVELLVRLYRDAGPKALVDWHYDAVAAHFLAGKAAMTTDWPGSYHAYQRSPVVGAKFDVAIYPKGPAGKRRVYSGGHSFALTQGTRDVPAALELLLFLTSDESQTHEARLGSMVPSLKAMQTIREEAAPGSREARRLAILEETMRDCMAIPPKFPAYPPCEDALWESVRSALTGERSTTAALDHAANAIRKIVRAAKPRRKVKPTAKRKTQAKTKKKTPARKKRASAKKSRKR